MILQRLSRRAARLMETGPVNRWPLCFLALGASFLSALTPNAASVQGQEPTGTIWVVQGRDLVPLSPSGTPLAPAIHLPTEAVFGLHGSADGRRLVVAGGRAQSFEPPEPPASRLYVVDTQTGTVVPVTPQAEPGCAPSADLRCELFYTDVAMSWDGQWVAAHRSWRPAVCRFDRGDGVVLQTWAMSRFDWVLVRPDGTQEKVLMPVGEFGVEEQGWCLFGERPQFREPEFSPDGGFLAQSWAHQTPHVKLIDLQTGRDEIILRGGLYPESTLGCSGARFLPDGLIACEYQIWNEFLHTGLALATVDDEVVSLILERSIFDERLELARRAASPDGQWLLAYEGWGETRRLVRVAVAGGMVVPVADGVVAAAWVGVAP